MTVNVTLRAREDAPTADAPVTVDPSLVKQVGGFVMTMAPKPRDVYERLDLLGLDWVCEELIQGRSIRSIARELDTSATSLLRWLDREPGRMRQYQLARQAQADAIVDELIELADSPVPVDEQGRTDSAAVNQLRLRVDTRKWIASKFRPGVYGDRVEVSADVSTKDLTPDQIMEKIEFMLGRNGLRIVRADAQTG